MGSVAQLASELDVPERTLRRAVALGAIHGRRLSERRLRLAAGEIDYLRRHWTLLVELRGALRTEQGVRLAVLFGSTARGDDDSSSDIDLLVDFSGKNPMGRLRLAIRLQEKLGRKVDVAVLSRAEHRDPFFLLQTIDEGRVIVDRDGRWPGLCSRRPAIYKRAMRSYSQQRERAAAALQELISSR